MASEVLPRQKKGGKKGLSHAEVGTKCFKVGLVLTQKLEVSDILMEGTNTFHPLKNKGVAQKV